MKKILAFGASNSQKSINQQFAAYVANQFEGFEIELINLNDFEMPLFGVDLEAEMGGQPEAAHRFLKHIEEADGIIVSLAEHNGNYTVAFKNITDWASRVEGKGKYWQEKPLFLLSTSPGKRGGASVMQISLQFFPFRGAIVVTHFSLPSFNQNFEPEQGVTDPDLAAGLNASIERFRAHLT